jgi:hypothetical protein
MAKKTFFMSVMFFVYSAICFFIFIDQIWTAITFTISSQYAFAAEVRMPPELLLSPTYLVRNPVVVAVQLRLTPSLLGGGGTEVLAIMLEDFFFSTETDAPPLPISTFLLLQVGFTSMGTSIAITLTAANLSRRQVQQQDGSFILKSDDPDILLLNTNQRSAARAHPDHPAGGGGVPRSEISSSSSQMPLLA